MEEIDKQQLNTIFHECRQCGTCCKSYPKILLEPEEVEPMKKLGANVGYMVHLDDLRTHNINELANQEKVKHKIYMVHPTEDGCIFLEKRNDKYYCKIYHYRPKSCKGFKCNLADGTIKDLFMKDAMYLLGKDCFGFDIKKD